MGHDVWPGISTSTRLRLAAITAVLSQLSADPTGGPSPVSIARCVNGHEISSTTWRVKSALRLRVIADFTPANRDLGGRIPRAIGARMMSLYRVSETEAR
jgi:hypothetical protein